MQFSAWNKTNISWQVIYKALKFNGDKWFEWWSFKCMNLFINHDFKQWHEHQIIFQSKHNHFHSLFCSMICKSLFWTHTNYILLLRATFEIVLPWESFSSLVISSFLHKKKKSESSLIYKIKQPDCIVRCIQNFCQRDTAYQVTLAVILAKFVMTFARQKT